MGRRLKFIKGRLCIHPRLGIVEMITWVGNKGIACIVRDSDECDIIIRDDYYYQLKSIE